tara:strand:- start:40 stop:1662 length:1623 start_codon:yes stop_codon:yes gene_type:complete
MATTVMAMAQKIKLSAIFLTLIYSNVAFAGEWQFKPSILIDETYTDNVGLVTNNEESSLVSQAGINIESTYKARNAILNFSSKSTYALYSHNHELDNDFHTVASDFRLQLWPNGIILVGAANISNQSKNGSRNALADIVSADTVQVGTYRGGIEYNINNSVFIVNSALGYNQTKSEDDIGDSEGVIANINSTNGKGARDFFWDLEHSYQELKNNSQEGKLSESEAKFGLITDYKINPFIRYYNEDNSGNITNPNRTIESSSYGLGLRWLISPRLYLDTSYNKPIGNKLDLDGNAQKEYINAEITWQPSSRTRLEASFSERFYGDSYGLNFTHRNRRLTNTVSYIEDIQTLTRNNFSANIIGYYFCPSSSISSTEDCILEDGTNIFPDNPSDPDNPGYQIFPIQDFILVEDNVFSLNKTLTWNSTLALARTTITLNVNRQKRDNLETRIKDETSAASLNFKRDISSRSNLSLDLSYTETNLQIDTELERIDRYRRYQIAYQKSLNSALLVNLAISYLDRNSNSSILNYQEGRISAKITKGF